MRSRRQHRAQTYGRGGRERSGQVEGLPGPWGTVQLGAKKPERQSEWWCTVYIILGQRGLGYRYRAKRQCCPIGMVVHLPDCARMRRRPRQRRALFEGEGVHYRMACISTGLWPVIQDIAGGSRAQGRPHSSKCGGGGTRAKRPGHSPQQMQGRASQDTHHSKYSR